MKEVTDVNEAVHIALQEGRCALVNAAGKRVGVISAPQDKRECPEEVIATLRQELHEEQLHVLELQGRVQKLEEELRDANRTISELIDP